MKTESLRARYLRRKRENHFLGDIICLNGAIQHGDNYWDAVKIFNTIPKSDYDPNDRDELLDQLKNRIKSAKKPL